MADAADIAQAQAEAMERLNPHRTRPTPAQLTEPDWDGPTAYCPHCGDDITTRAQQGLGLCVPCAEVAERKRAVG
jgi:hypothetical protein